MLLKSLVEYYDTLVNLGKVPPFDMSDTKVGFAIDLNMDGTVKRVVSLRERIDRSNKEVSKNMFVPLQKKRSSGIAPYFLADKMQYVLGCKCKKVRSENGTDQAVEKIITSQYFDAFAALHHKVLDDCNGEKAETILRFVDTLCPGKYPDILEENIEMLDANGTQPQIVLRDETGNSFISDPEIREAWDKYLISRQEKMKSMTDLIDGRKMPVQELHGAVKGIGSTAGGVSLISYNKNSFESYGLEHGENSPVSVMNEQKYVATLNYLFSSADYVTRIGKSESPSMYITYWAANGNSIYQDIFSDEYNGQNKLDRDDLKEIVKQVANGMAINYQNSTISPEEKFYLLGVSANAARLSVQFFYENSFGNVLQNVYQHQKRLEIIGAKNGETLPIYRILNETVRQISGQKLETNPSPSIAGGLYKAVFQNTRYPEAIFSQIIARVKADNTVTYAKAEIIKAYLIKNGNSIPKEVLTVDINKESNYAPYVFGRVFAVLEKIQRDVSPSITTTIKDRYIGRAASDPVVVFPGLMRLSQNHQRKLSEGGKVYYSNLLNELMSKLPEKFPKHLSLEEQGSFYLGYYHENQELYKKKIENKEEN